MIQPGELAGNAPALAWILPLAVFAFYLHLTTYLSLYFRMGGVILSFVLCYVAAVIVGTLWTASGWDDRFVAALCVGAAFAGTVVLHLKIGGAVRSVGLSMKVAN